MEESIKEEENQNKKGSMLYMLAFIIIMILSSILLRAFVMTPYQVPSGSMEDTIAIGDMIIAEKVSLNFKEPEPGNIIVFKDPQDNTRTLVKRVVATEGQTVDLYDGHVYIDGDKLEESYTDEESYPLYKTAAQVEYPFVVPEGCIWVMGDNRDNSLDSRYFGAVDKSSVLGYAIVKYWPIEHFSIL